MTDVPVGTAFLAATQPRGKAADRSRAVQGLPSKNTGDLQWEMRANCNASPCVNERNVAGPGTMGINGKTMRRTMEAMKNTGERLRPVVTPEDRR